MNEMLDFLKTRRSCRRYKPDMVPAEVLDQIMEAGLYAPSAMNRQLTKILCITNREVRERLSKMNAAVMGADMDPFYGAPVVLVVLASKAMPTGVADGSLVMQNLMLAAHALGVGSCWIHRAKEEFETEEGKEILRAAGIEGEWEGIGHCILGYADSEPADLPRAEGRIHRID